jgi:hypothetical protein
MDFHLDHALPLLERTPAALTALLAGLPEPWIRGDDGPQTWAPFDVVGHLIHGERTDWLPRARIVLEHGPAQPFEPFDRFAMLNADRGATMGELLETFAALRALNVASLRGLALQEADLDRRGTHPEFGAVTMRQLLATWVVHDLSHLAQIAEVMARQYRAEVGPWGAYLPVLEG